MKVFKRLIFILITMCPILMLNGCSYANNKGWDDLSAKEKREAYQELEKIKSDYSEDDSIDRMELYIINKVEKAIDETENGL